MIRQAILIEEFSRLGGGQAVAYNIVNALSNRYQFNLITDSQHSELDPSPFDNIFETSYRYSDGISIPTLIWGIIKTKKELSNMRDKISGALTINNHPNMFLFNADINIIHVFFLRNSKFARFVKLSGIYKVYSDAKFILSGKFMEKLAKQEYRYLGISPKITVIPFPVSYPVQVDLGLKKDLVLTFGRINKEKSVESVLEIAKKSNLRFVIAGAVNRGSERYAEMLKLSKSNNVSIIENPSEEKKIELFTKARVYLHTRRNENYGLTVAEAIGYGCIPVVPKSGGPWVDIIEEGKYGYGYDTLEEASEIISGLMNKGINFRKDILESRQRFSFETFKEKLVAYVDDIENKK